MVAIGNRYEETKTMDIRDIAKLIRADIKAAIKAGTVPAEYKYSVRIRRFAGGSAIDVSIDGAPDMRAEYYTGYDEWFDKHPGTEWRERPAAKLVETIESIVRAYNRQDIDTMTDYFDVRFYAHVSYGY